MLAASCYVQGRHPVVVSRVDVHLPATHQGLDRGVVVARSCMVQRRAPKVILSLTPGKLSGGSSDPLVVVRVRLYAD